MDFCNVLCYYLNDCLDQCCFVTVNFIVYIRMNDLCYRRSQIVQSNRMSNKFAPSDFIYRQTEKCLGLCDIFMIANY